MLYPFVSIIVLNYNGKKFIRGCISSLLKQSYPKSRYEIVFVDNASSDGSVELVRKKFKKQIREKRIKVIQNSQNLGFTGGNNIGIFKSCGSYIAFFNNDAVADKLWLAELIKVIESDNKIGIVTCHIDNANAAHFGGGTVNSILGIAKGLPYNYKEPTETGFGNGCAMLFRRELVEKIGILLDDLFIYLEDIDFSLRAKQAGYKIVFVPSAKVFHYGSMTINAMEQRGEYVKMKMTRNRSALIFLHCPLPLLPIAVFYDLSATFYMFFRALLGSDIGKQYVFQKLSAYKLFPKMMKIRAKNKYMPSIKEMMAVYRKR